MGREKKTRVKEVNDKTVLPQPGVVVGLDRAHRQHRIKLDINS